MTIEMTKEQYDTLIYFLNHDGSLLSLLEEFDSHRGQTLFGIPRKDLMGELSFEDLAQAWLDLETIKVVGDENE